jgi:hypothetical protein
VAKSKNQTIIRILNPADGRGHTSHKNAKRYVELKQARYDTDANGQYLEFIGLDSGAQRAVAASRGSPVDVIGAAPPGLTLIHGRAHTAHAGRTNALYDAPATVTPIGQIGADRTLLGK